MPSLHSGWIRPHTSRPSSSPVLHPVNTLLLTVPVILASVVVPHYKTVYNSYINQDVKQMVPPLQRAPTDKLIFLVSGRSDLLLPLLHCIVQLLLGKELLMKYHLCSFFYTKMVQCFLSKNGYEIIHFSITLNVIHPYTWIVINWPYDILEVWDITTPVPLVMKGLN